jgi:hypothetical protein
LGYFQGFRGTKHLGLCLGSPFTKGCHYIHNKSNIRNTSYAIKSYAYAPYA